jgi:hypothetical protein
MNPCFSAESVRRCLPIVRNTAWKVPRPFPYWLRVRHELMNPKLVDRWESLGFPDSTVNISGTLHEAVLDTMGDGEFSFTPGL